MIAPTCPECSLRLPLLLSGKGEKKRKLHGEHTTGPAPVTPSSQAVWAECASESGRRWFRGQIEQQIVHPASGASTSSSATAASRWEILPTGIGPVGARLLYLKKCTAKIFASVNNGEPTHKVRLLVSTYFGDDSRFWQTEKGGYSEELPQKVVAFMFSNSFDLEEKESENFLWKTEAEETLRNRLCPWNYYQSIYSVQGRIASKKKHLEDFFFAWNSLVVKLQLEPLPMWKLFAFLARAQEEVDKRLVDRFKRWPGSNFPPIDQPDQLWNRWQSTREIVSAQTFSCADRHKKFQVLAAINKWLLNAAAAHTKQKPGKIRDLFERKEALWIDIKEPDQNHYPQNFARQLLDPSFWSPGTADKPNYWPLSYKVDAAPAGLFFHRCHSLNGVEPFSTKVYDLQKPEEEKEFLVQQWLPDFQFLLLMESRRMRIWNFSAQKFEQKFPLEKNARGQGVLRVTAAWSYNLSTKAWVQAEREGSDDDGDDEDDEDPAQTLKEFKDTVRVLQECLALSPKEQRSFTADRLFAPFGLHHDLRNFNTYRSSVLEPTHGEQGAAAIVAKGLENGIGRRLASLKAKWAEIEARGGNTMAQKIKHLEALENVLGIYREDVDGLVGDKSFLSKRMKVILIPNGGFVHFEDRDERLTELFEGYPEAKDMAYLGGIRRVPCALPDEQRRQKGVGLALFACLLNRLAHAQPAFRGLHIFPDLRTVIAGQKRNLQEHCALLRFVPDAEFPKHGDYTFLYSLFGFFQLLLTACVHQEKREWVFNGVKVSLTPSNTAKPFRFKRGFRDRARLRATSLEKGGGLPQASFLSLQNSENELLEKFANRMAPLARAAREGGAEKERRFYATMARACVRAQLGGDLGSLSSLGAFSPSLLSA